VHYGETAKCTAHDRQYCVNIQHIPLVLTGTLIAESLAMVILIMAVSTAVVSIVIGRQNRGAANRQIERSLNILREELLGEIAATSDEQASGIEGVNMAVAEMDKVTQKNGSAAEEWAAVADNLNLPFDEMKGIVGDMVSLVGGGTNGTSPDSGKGRNRVGKSPVSGVTPLKEWSLTGVSPDMATVTIGEGI